MHRVSTRAGLPQRFAAAVLLIALGVACENPPAPTPSAPTSTAAAAPKTAAPAIATSAAATPTEAAQASPPATPPSEPAAWDIDASHSVVGFSVRHMMVSNTRGRFGKVTGSAYIDERDLSKTNVSVEIETTSVDTGDAKRDEHLRADDFFNVKKFPKMTFKSTKVERAGAGFKVTGDLTIRDVTKAVVLDIEPLSPEAKDPWGGVRRGTRARAKINRTDFGLKYNAALETGGVAVGEEVTIELEVELIKKKAG
jgi:polyisoprenoid-binding protein YceI